VSDIVLRGLDTALPGLLAAPGAGRGAPQADGDAERAAKDFESVLLHRVLEEMRRSIGDSGLLESGISEQVQGLFWMYLAEELGRSGGLGLWKNLMGQFAGPDDAATPPAVEQTR